MKASRLPSRNEIADVLREEFRIRYHKLDGAVINYNDPLFDEKRLWACRLLSQFLLDGALVISVDESHIRSDKGKKYAWQFVGNDRAFKKVMYGLDRQPAQMLEQHSQSSWGEISSIVSEMSRPGVKSVGSVLGKRSLNLQTPGSSIHLPSARQKKSLTNQSSSRDSVNSRHDTPGCEEEEVKTVIYNNFFMI